MKRTVAGTEEVLTFIKTYIAQNSRPPTYDEMEQGLGMSRGCIAKRIAKLIETGKVIRVPKISRGLQVVG